MSFIKALDISASGLYAHKKRIEIIAQNIANADTMITDSGEPYRRKAALLRETKDLESFSSTLDKFSTPKAGKGVEVTAITEDSQPFKMVYNPDHPLASEDGYIKVPNVDTTNEMLELLAATRAYEANAAVVDATKAIFAKSMEILK